MGGHLTLDFWPVLRVCDYLKHGPDSTFLGTEVHENPDFLVDPGRNPRRYIRSAWMQDIMGIEVGFEMLDSSLTIYDIHATRYELVGRDWAIQFRFARRSGYLEGGSLLFDGARGEVRSAVFDGDLEAYTRDMMLLSMTDAVEVMNLAPLSAKWQPVREVKLTYGNYVAS